jgi:signal transduction histidine kinase
MPLENDADHPDRKWKVFSLSIVGVLSASILAVLLCVAAITAVQLGGLARSELTRKAEEIARFMARTTFVPVSLDDRALLQRSASVYFDDPDLALGQVFDTGDKILLSRPGAAAASRGPTVEAISAIQAPTEFRDSGVSVRTVGRVRIVLSLSRKYRVVKRAFLWIAAAGLLLLLAAVGLDVLLIRRMTGKLEELVGEARLAQELKRSNRELEEFAFVASHDLQEPLRKVVNFSQLLSRRCSGKLDADADELIKTIISGASRMSALIQDLLSYSRVGTQGKPFVPTDLAAVAAEALSLVGDTIRGDGAAVACDPLPVVLGDEGQLVRLFENLLANSLKFHGEAPVKIRVGAVRQNKEFWRLSVQDNGIGIDPKYHDRVFEMFKRLHARDKYPGTGIGLAVCKKIVERHGGRIWIESAAGQGTSFHFTLRAAAA